MQHISEQSFLARCQVGGGLVFRCSVTVFQRFKAEMEAPCMPGVTASEVWFQDSSQKRLE